MAPLLRLASNSPRRKQLLALTGISFTVRPADIDESVLTNESPPDYVLRLAETKARVAALTAKDTGIGSGGEIILAADTTVAHEGRILGKPASIEEAREILRSLRGRVHDVYTAITVVDPDSNRLATDLCATRVWMRTYTDEEIETYIASGDPFDKAGGYAIQNQDFHPVEKIDGCFACVMGLPVCHVIRILQEFGFSSAGTLVVDCPDYLGMESACPVCEQILPDQQNQKAESGRD